MLCALLAGALTACGTLPYKTVPERLADSAELPDLPGVRYWSDAAPANASSMLAMFADKLRHGVHHRAPALPWRALPATFRRTGERYHEGYLSAALRQVRGPVPLPISRGV